MWDWGVQISILKHFPINQRACNTLKGKDPFVYFNRRLSWYACFIESLTIATVTTESSSEACRPFLWLACSDAVTKELGTLWDTFVNVSTKTQSTCFLADRGTKRFKIRQSQGHTSALPQGLQGTQLTVPHFSQLEIQLIEHGCSDVLCLFFLLILGVTIMNTQFPVVHVYNKKKTQIRRTWMGALGVWADTLSKHSGLSLCHGLWSSQPPTLKKWV